MPGRPPARNQNGRAKRTADAAAAMSAAPARPRLASESPGMRAVATGDDEQEKSREQRHVPGVGERLTRRDEAEQHRSPEPRPQVPAGAPWRRTWLRAAAAKRRKIGIART